MASAPGRPRQRIETFSIPHIVDLAVRGLLRVPDVARPYVWGPTQVRELFDSLFHGYPIGAFVLLEGAQPAAEPSSPRRTPGRKPGRPRMTRS